MGGLLNINQGKVQGIHQGDYQWNWFMVKNMTESWMPMLERSRYKTGAGQNVKH